jgi:hypothetical protein
LRLTIRFPNVRVENLSAYRAFQAPHLTPLPHIPAGPTCAGRGAGGRRLARTHGSAAKPRVVRSRQHVAGREIAPHSDSSPARPIRPWLRPDLRASIPHGLHRRISARDHFGLGDPLARPLSPRTHGPGMAPSARPSESGRPSITGRRAERHIAQPGSRMKPASIVFVLQLRTIRHGTEECSEGPVCCPKAYFLNPTDHSAIFVSVHR